ncbi:hypothetical protein ACSFBX_10060 [Variovorax sp. RB2P76]|uniref:hypothetical protein n=1 Tax=Variovorax sp. RB2P76 TaxID=3443736 RepID=UPI003F486D09
MRKTDCLLVLGLALLMAPFTYYAGARPSTFWESMYGLPYLVANVTTPAVVAIWIYVTRSSQASDE